MTLWLCLSVTGVRQQSSVCLQGELYCLPLVLCQSSSFIVLPLSRVPLTALCCTAAMFRGQSAQRSGLGEMAVRLSALQQLDVACQRAERLEPEPWNSGLWITNDGVLGSKQCWPLTRRQCRRSMMQPCSTTLKCTNAPQQAWWRQIEELFHSWKCKHSSGPDQRKLCFFSHVMCRKQC